MQPYFFPYMGYFQLIHAVDTFVFYDDASFIKQGWINRNRILSGGRDHYFTAPVMRASSFVPINRTLIHTEQFPRWRRKFLRLLQESYARSPRRHEVIELVAGVLCRTDTDVSSLARRSVEACCQYLGLSPQFLVSSRDLAPSEARGSRRVIEICQAIGASCYVNAPGGRDLYDEGLFEQAGLELRFLTPQLEPYPQGTTRFIGSMSILDVLMNQPRHEVARAMTEGQLSCQRSADF